MSYYRLVASEDVQYFHFDKDGNMFIYKPGAGFSGNCKLVTPGEEIFTNKSKESMIKVESQCDGSNSRGVKGADNSALSSMLNKVSRY